MHILHIVGARPNFMKAAPVLRALRNRGFRQTLVHTGQHYDVNMSDVFFQQLQIPEPDVNLSVGSGSHAQQTGEIMIRFEPVLLERKPDLVMVYGDVNSTVATALVSSKLHVRVAHVEAGLRSFDRTMPEEINRLLTDQLADMLFTPSEDGNENLMREGVAPDAIFLVGNVMIDTLVQLLPQASEDARKRELPGRFALVTLHRPSNVDEPEMLGTILATLHDISSQLPVIFPVHPRTRNRIVDMGFAAGSNLLLWEPLSYIEFLGLQQRATVVITDSGGIQEETTFLGVPCLTLRENTERPVTISCGTNIMIGRDMGRLRAEVRTILSGNARKGSVPQLWDGHAAERIAGVLESQPEDINSIPAVVA